MILCMVKGIPRLAVRSFLSEPSLFLSTSTPPPLTSNFRRYESSYRRTRKKLAIKPDPSFLSSSCAGSDALSAEQDHIVFNPPSSAPSIYHTPIKFLPKDDPRRVLFLNNQLQQQQHTSSSSSSTTAAEDSPSPPPPPPPPLPPPIRKPYTKSYHLTETDIAEIRRLRQKDPDMWTRTKLAKKFKCSSLFVGIVCQATKERLEQRAEALEAIKARWGKKRTMAREDRVRRRELWGRDE
ncbi:MAG: hypothetical protein M1816_006364 [Peltula sp. TS41687]|nr:MAG: hypothetical protein M1816_006364 [Peltula sp. TS41687]